MNEELICPLCDGKLERNFDVKKDNIKTSFICIDCKRGWQILEKYINDGILKSDIKTSLEDYNGDCINKISKSSTTNEGKI